MIIDLVIEFGKDEYEVSLPQYGFFEKLPNVAVVGLQEDDDAETALSIGKHLETCEEGDTSIWEKEFDDVQSKPIYDSQNFRYELLFFAVDNALNSIGQFRKFGLLDKVRIKLTVPGFDEVEMEQQQSFIYSILHFKWVDSLILNKIPAELTPRQVAHKQQYHSLKSGAGLVVSYCTSIVVIILWGLVGVYLASPLPKLSGFWSILIFSITVLCSLAFSLAVFGSFLYGIIIKFFWSASVVRQVIYESNEPAMFKQVAQVIIRQIYGPRLWNEDFDTYYSRQLESADN